jgi:hypothetical protein
MILSVYKQGITLPTNKGVSIMKQALKLLTRLEVIEDAALRHGTDYWSDDQWDKYLIERKALTQELNELFPHPEGEEFWDLED